MEVSRCGDCTESGQMTVELAVSLPIALVVLLISVNLMMFLSQCARFDNIAAQAVITCATGLPAGSDSLAKETQLEIGKRMGPNPRLSYSVREVPVGAGVGFVGTARTYECEMRFSPWPAPGRSVSVAGTSSGAITVLKRVRHISIDPYRPGSVL